MACNDINFDSEQLADLPFMELVSSGAFPSVVPARRCLSCPFSFDVGCRLIITRLMQSIGRAKRT